MLDVRVFELVELLAMKFALVVNKRDIEHGLTVLRVRVGINTDGNTHIMRTWTRRVGILESAGYKRSECV